VVFGSFGIDMKDLNSSIQADMDVHNIPNLTQPLKVIFSSENLSSEDASVNIVAPQDAISADDLGLGFAGPSITPPSPVVDQ